MHIASRLFCLLLLAIAAFSAIASQEGTLSLSEFRLETVNDPALGRVVISGSQSFPDFTRLEADAFGRHFSLAPKQLQQLKNFSANGAQVSQISPGHSSGGGMVYLVLTNGLMSDEPERRFVVFTANGKVGVGSKP